MEIKAYFAEVKRTYNRLNRELAEGQHEGQFTDFSMVDNDDTGEQRKVMTWVYMISVQNRPAGVTAGKVVSMTLSHAARCMADATHVVATGEQITEWLEYQRQQKIQHDRLDTKSNLQRMQVVVDNLNPLPAHLMPTEAKGAVSSKPGAKSGKVEEKAAA